MMPKEPYLLDTSQKKMVEDIALYQLVVGDTFTLHGYENQTLIQGMRGGWVPSLEVLEPSEHGTPWLDADSMITRPEARVSGPILLQNSRWESTQALRALSSTAWWIRNSRFQGNATITLASPDKLNTHYHCMDEVDMHDGVIEGAIHMKTVRLVDTNVHTTGYMSMGDAQLHHSQIINNACHLSIRKSRLEHVTFHQNNQIGRLVLKNVHWKHVRYALAEATPFTQYFSIENSNLAHVHSTHPELSNTWCHRLYGGEVQAPRPVGYHLSEEYFFVPLARRGRYTHFAWYHTATQKPIGIYDEWFQEWTSLADVPARISHLRARDHPMEAHSANTLDWWHWQHTLGVEPPRDGPWTIASGQDPHAGLTPVSFACDGGAAP